MMRLNIFVESKIKPNVRPISSDTKAPSTCPSKTVRLTYVNRMRLVACDWRPCFPPHMYAFIPRRRPVARISQGGSYSGEKWTLRLKGGGVSFGKNVDLCTVPYGAFGPRGGGLPTPQNPPPGYGPATRVHFTPNRRDGNTWQARSQPSRWGGGGGGGGSELGWVEHYRSIQGMVGLSRIMGETRSLAPIAVDG